jgi:hypothetical protein
MHKSIFELGDTQRLLCRAISAHAGDHEDSLDTFLGQSGTSAFYELAAENDVTAHIGHLLAERGETDVRYHAWLASHAETQRRIDGYMNELDRVAAALADEDISLVTLKNTGIARGLGICRGCCPMGDVDALVRPADFRRAHNIMQKLGYVFEFRSPLEESEIEAAERAGGAEYWITLDGEQRLWFELQWRPVAGRWLRPEQEPSADELVDRSLPIAGTKARMLATGDNLLQVCLHTAKHSYVRAPGFRLHTDVDRIVKHHDVDWDEFVTAVKSLQVCTAVYFSLAIPHQIFNTPIPATVLQELSPRNLKRSGITSLLRKAGLFASKQPKFNRWTYIAFTALLYDDMAGLWKGVFPDPTWMRETFGVESGWSLAICYLRRLWDLTFRRANT